VQPTDHDVKIFRALGERCSGKRHGVPDGKPGEEEKQNQCGGNYIQRVFENLHGDTPAGGIIVSVVTVQRLLQGYNYFLWVPPKTWIKCRFSGARLHG
jgi:hypothetical protein